MPISTASRIATQAGASQMQAHAHDAAVLLRSLANEQRLIILCQLVEGEQPVNAIHAHLEISQSALSQHLALLRESGLVDTRREGQQVFYRLRDGPAGQIMNTLHEIYCGG
jgi:DNA-binding transcriptional ArsR family regulator